MSANSGPGYLKNPTHRVKTARAAGRIRLTFQGEVIADTHDAIRLEESGYSPVFYIPRKDVNMARLVRTTHRSYCPYKGQASYFSLTTDGRVEENAVWSYEKPYDEVASIREFLAFYPNRVDGIEELPA
ncbi:MAG TPA: DUF427 domain-containing protein [Burkholderiales bacterium]|nr:DUF427 domain-containing protein [Burkholderiales bacterium]